VSFAKALHDISHHSIILIRHRLHYIENRALGMVFLGPIEQIRLLRRKPIPLSECVTCATVSTLPMRLVLLARPFAILPAEIICSAASVVSQRFV
jgi:hypothetical protein